MPENCKCGFSGNIMENPLQVNEKIEKAFVVYSYFDNREFWTRCNERKAIVIRCGAHMRWNQNSFFAKIVDGRV